MVLPKQPTHWITVTDEEWDNIKFFVENLVEDWWNPSEGEFPLINPHEDFFKVCASQGIRVYDCKKPWSEQE